VGKAILAKDPLQSLHAVKGQSDVELGAGAVAASLNFNMAINLVCANEASPASQEVEILVFQLVTSALEK
jgi:hypothetical protein